MHGQPHIRFRWKLFYIKKTQSLIKLNLSLKKTSSDRVHWPRTPFPAGESIHIPLLICSPEDSSSGLYSYYFLGDAKSSVLVSRGAAMQGEQCSSLFSPPPSAHKSPPGALLPLLALHSSYLHLWTALRQTAIPLRTALLLFFRSFLFFSRFFCNAFLPSLQSSVIYISERNEWFILCARSP